MSMARLVFPSRLELKRRFRIVERCALGESQLDDALVGLAGAKDPAVRPHRNASPLPFLDRFRVGLLDELSHAGQRLAAPVIELLDPRVDQCEGDVCASFEPVVGCGSLIHPSQQIFEAVEPALPEAFHLARPIDQRAQGADLGAVVGLTALMTITHQPGPLEDSEMLRDGGLRHAGLSGQRPNRLFAPGGKGVRRSPAASGRRGFGKARLGRWSLVSITIQI